jgi:hypothetical protein
MIGGKCRGDALGGKQSGEKRRHLRLEVVAISPSKDQVAEQNSFFEL